MNLRKYVSEKLKGDACFDGLCCPDIPCGCGIDDLMPCDEPSTQCKPAWLCVCAETPECEHHGNCDTEGEHAEACYRPGKRP